MKLFQSSLIFRICSIVGGCLWTMCLLSVFCPVQAEWQGQLSLLTDYVYRGYSKNRSNPLAQGRLDYQHESGWFAGIGLSQVSFDDRINSDYADIEIKPSMGWSVAFTPDWRGEVFASGYIYDGPIFGHDANFVEFYAAAHYQDSLSAKISVAPNAYQRHVTVPNYEISYRRDILDTVQLSAALSYYQAGALLGEDFFYWNLGASWFVTSYLVLDLRYVDMHIKESDSIHHSPDEFYPRPLENNFLFSISLGF
jgi:uncharacterized protein (TIGR02001 family)